MSRREELLEDHVYIVGGKVKENIDAPNGVPCEVDIEAIQKELLIFTTEHLTSTLIDVKKELEMGQIPGWDSMNSVNLQLSIKEEFDVELGDFSLNDYSTVKDIIDFLSEKGIKVKE